jgi:hypothetical protein
MERTFMQVPRRNLRNGRDIPIDFEAIGAETKPTPTTAPLHLHAYSECDA